MDDVRCRPAGAQDLPFLAAMLGEAAFWRPDKPTPTAEAVMADPRFSIYLAGWPRTGDLGLVAEQDGPLGAAWYRTFTESEHGHGFVAPDVPELSVAVLAQRRREGIGRRLLIALIDASEAEGHTALSLCVNHGNPARHLYEELGFRPVGTPRETAVTMIRQAVPRHAGHPPPVGDRTGCSDGAIDAAEATLGVVLPAELRAALRRADGWHDPDGDWWVVSPLARLVEDNQANWEHGTVPRELVGFGDDGAGSPFCLWLDARSPEVVRWSAIDAEVEDRWADLDAFATEWCPGWA